MRLKAAFEGRFRVRPYWLLTVDFVFYMDACRLFGMALFHSCDSGNSVAKALLDGLPEQGQWFVEETGGIALNN